jgi:hypothetical protein
MTERKPHNYFNEQSPEQQEEHRRLDAMIAEAERYRKIGEAVNMFESFQRWLKTARPNLKPKPRYRAKSKSRLGLGLGLRPQIHYRVKPRAKGFKK